MRYGVIVGRGETMLKKILVYILAIIIIIIVVRMYWNTITTTISYQDWDIITKLITGLAPFVAVYFAYCQWKKNREAEIKNLEYKNEYYKMILSKRIEAYVTLNHFLFSIDQSESFKNSKVSTRALPYHCFFNNRQTMEKVFEELTLCVCNNMWFSEDTRSKLHAINKLLIKVLDDIKGKNTISLTDAEKEEKMRIEKEVSVDCVEFKRYGKQKSTIVYGLLFFKKMQLLILELRLSTYSSMQTMYKIDGFFQYNIEGLNNDIEYLKRMNVD